MGMLKSRADELERRLNQTREVLKGGERGLESFITDIKQLANDVEKIETENVQMKKQLEDQAKDLDKVTKEKDVLVRQQK